MNVTHRHFEIQCVLASCGQLSPGEFAELQKHADSCRDCRSCIREMVRINSHLLAMRNVGRVCSRAPRGGLERFIQRANREGVSIARRRIEFLRSRASGFAVACLLAIIAVLGTYDLCVTSGPGRRSPVGGSATQSASDLRASSANKVDSKLAAPTSSYETAAGTVARHHVVKFSFLPERRSAADLDPETAARIAFGTAYPIGVLVERFRYPNLTPTLRPSNFHLSFDPELARPADPDTNPNECQHGFCFNPQLVFLASYDSPHIPAFDWVVSGEFHEARDSFSTPPSAP